jgi:hypothetical protein
MYSGENSGYFGPVRGNLEDRILDVGGLLLDLSRYIGYDTIIDACKRSEFDLLVNCLVKIIKFDVV